ncbi:conserved membrane hypothetical protein [Arthrobacter sp. 9AX]|uniref:DUF4870 domain-containing protein n=1 Tax=Arthrobacter sp. 9AX TaxID=2653131 RepID=UPI0012F2FFEE|nr:DUF4870 domain-containing protein [Arthrobacter sp. 9AX]VXC15781.1 conserved membrane hypothetical protein [Arthrobacter sp. 9AX]
MSQPEASPYPEKPVGPPAVNNMPHGALPSTGSPTLYRPPVPPSEYQLHPLDDKQWGTFAHFGGLAGFIPTLVIYLVFKDRGRFARQESAEALNFHINLAAANILFLVFSLIPIIGLLFSLALFGLWIAVMVFSILAGISAARGNPYRYPILFRVIN